MVSIVSSRERDGEKERKILSVKEQMQDLWIVVSNTCVWNIIGKGEPSEPSDEFVTFILEFTWSIIGRDIIGVWETWRSYCGHYITSERFQIHTWDLSQCALALVDEVIINFRIEKKERNEKVRGVENSHLSGEWQ